DMEVDPLAAAQEIRDKVNAIKSELPTGIEEPVVARYDMNAEPVASIALTSETLSQRELSILLEERIKPALQQITGVGQISVYGEEKREIQMLMRPEALRAFSVSTAELSDNITKAIKETPGGNLENSASMLSVSTRFQLSSPRELEGLMVAKRGGQPLYFRQLGRVEDTIKDRTSMARYDGTPAIGIEIGKQSGGNAVKIAAAVKTELAKVQETLPADVQVHLVRDDAQRIEESIHSVYEDLILGGIFAVLVVFLFLGDIRSTMISAVTLPTSIVATFFFMHLSGFGINTMSMLGLSLAIGLLIDDAIVVVENIIRHREKGEEPGLAAALGTKEIVLAVMATSLSVVAVFLPMGFMKGTVAGFFKEFGLTITFAVMVSLFISFTLTPMLASRFLRPQEKRTNAFFRFQEGFSRRFDGIAESYGRLLERILCKWRKQTAVLSLVLFLASLSITGAIGLGSSLFLF
ncbi:MAG: efflux RND transporter permease subunit, partial [Selenomonadaceae bacterium]|nr:efflux RND transporter permease subunit [Selenomonadaceae bacterium]